VLGRVPTARNVYLATGHGATGLQVGPYSGKLVADLVLGETIEVDLDPFAVTRF
jgi:D-amino-acid dehydrogenase